MQRPNLDDYQELVWFMHNDAGAIGWSISKEDRNAGNESRDNNDWESKLFKPEVEPSQEHLLKQMIHGKFAYQTKTLVSLE